MSRYLAYTWPLALLVAVQLMLLAPVQAQLFQQFFGGNGGGSMFGQREQEPPPVRLISIPTRGILLRTMQRAEADLSRFLILINALSVRRRQLVRSKGGCGSMYTVLVSQDAVMRRQAVSLSMPVPATNPMLIRRHKLQRKGPCTASGRITRRSRRGPRSGRHLLYHGQQL